jgi:hypothetical protein
VVGKGIGLLLLSAMVALGFAKHQDRVREQVRLGAIASEIADRPVEVRCPGFLKKLVDVRGEAGHVKFDENGRPARYTDLSPSTCDRLRSFGRVDFSCLDDRSCGDAEFAAAWAAHTLAHESYHLRGYAEERVAECYALQITGLVAERLGLAPDRAALLQKWVYDRGYRNEPTEYQSPQCYDGGPFDLHPGSKVWP